MYEALTEEYSVPCTGCGKPIATQKYCSSCGAPNPINYIDESVKVSKTRPVKRTKREVPVRIIVAGAAVALIVLATLFAGSTYALSHMQYRVEKLSKFDFATLGSEVSLEACNPTPFPGMFDRMTGVAYYKDGEFARLAIGGGLVMPYQESSFDGQLRLNSEAPVQGIIIALGDAISGADSRYDENDMKVKTTVDGTILGILPYSQTHEFTFAQFRNLMSAEQASQYQCGQS